MVDDFPVTASLMALAPHITRAASVVRLRPVQLQHFPRALLLVSALLASLSTGSSPTRPKYSKQ